MWSTSATKRSQISDNPYLMWKLLYTVMLKQRWLLSPQCICEGKTEREKSKSPLKLKDWSMQKPSSSHVQVVTKQCRESKQVFPKGHMYQVERQKVRDVKMYIKNLPNFSFSVPLGARTQMFFIFCPWILGDFYLNLVDVGEFLFLIAKSVFIVTFYSCIHDTLLRLSS